MDEECVQPPHLDVEVELAVFDRKPRLRVAFLFSARDDDVGVDAPEDENYMAQCRVEVSEDQVYGGQVLDVECGRATLRMQFVPYDGEGPETVSGSTVLGSC